MAGKMPACLQYLPELFRKVTRRDSNIRKAWMIASAYVTWRPCDLPLSLCYQRAEGAAPLKSTSFCFDCDHIRDVQSVLLRFLDGSGVART